MCKESENIKKNKTGNSLVVQGLGLSTFTARTRVQSLVRELRSCQPHGTAAANSRGMSSQKSSGKRGASSGSYPSWIRDSKDEQLKETG